MTEDPLAGFVIFANTREIIQITIGSGYVRLSNDALRVIGSPEAVNVFFDDSRKRMMIKGAKKNMPNIFTFRDKGQLQNYAGIREKILELAEIEYTPGDNIKINGYKYMGDYVIFHLKDYRKTHYQAALRKSAA